MRSSIVLFSLLALFTAAGAGHAGQQVYKWVDKDGNVHYTNMPPPEAAQRERQVLDEYGDVAKVLKAPKTPEEIEAEKLRLAELERQKKLAEERAANDNMLLKTYIAVEEMEMARDGRINALEAQIRVVSGTINSLETRLADLARRVGIITNNGKPVPEALQKDIEQTRAELLDNQKFLIAHKEKQDEIREQFAEDIARFKELKGIK